MKLKKILIWLRHEIIGYRVKDPFEVLREYNDEKCQKLFTAMLDYYEDNLFIPNFVDIFLFRKSGWKIEWDKAQQSFLINN